MHTVITVSQTARSELQLLLPLLLCTLKCIAIASMLVVWDIRLCVVVQLAVSLLSLAVFQFLSTIMLFFPVVLRHRVPAPT
jgi:NADH:ubiquinone oxidoreductase subunit 3 (subunit A)